MSYEPEINTEPPEDKPDLYCESDDCIDPGIYQGQDYYKIDDQIFCESCGKAYLDYLYKRGSI